MGEVAAVRELFTTASRTNRTRHQVQFTTTSPRQTPKPIKVCAALPGPTPSGGCKSQSTQDWRVLTLCKYPALTPNMRGNSWLAVVSYEISYSTTDDVSPVTSTWCSDGCNWSRDVTSINIFKGVTMWRAKANKKFSKSVLVSCCWCFVMSINTALFWILQKCMILVEFFSRTRSEETVTAVTGLWELQRKAELV